MRILFVNDGIGDAGGVQSYLAAVATSLRQRGHTLAFLHLDALRTTEPSPMPSVPHFCVADGGMASALGAAHAWQPTVVFSHNMRDLDVEEGLFALAPVVKMMHGYFGSCVSGQKMHRAPRAVPCGRRLGVACLALYVPRRCGVLSLDAMVGGYARADRQRRFYGRYHSMVVASTHMREEYIRNGMPADRVVTNPLFATASPGRAPTRVTSALRVLFLGRMTHLKGGNVLIRAVEAARTRVETTLVMAGDGPQRSEWEALAEQLGVRATFPGWVGEGRRDELLRDASVLAIPSVWPEPFGLCGLEAAAAGVPSVAFDVGGIREWLRDGENGRMVPYDGNAVGSLATALAELGEQPMERARLAEGAFALSQSMTLDAHVQRLETTLRANR